MLHKRTFPPLPNQNILPVGGYVYSTQYANDATVQQWERSPTAQNANLSKQHLHYIFLYTVLYITVQTVLYITVQTVVIGGVL